MNKTQETELIKRIGLDRTVVTGFRIKSINWEILKSFPSDLVEISKEGKMPYNLEDGTSFTKLKIIDNNKFGTFSVYTKANIWKVCSSIDICLSNGIWRNLQNDTIADYHIKIHEIFRYLRERYGIDAEYTNLKFRLMELNTTFLIEKEFYQYHRALKILFCNLPKTYKAISQYSSVNSIENRLESETFSRENNRMQIKAYDKGKQLSKVTGESLESNYMRIEFVLKDSIKIMEVFKTNQVFEITDKMINEYYKSQFDKLIVSKYRKWQVQNKKILRQLMGEHKEKSKQNWLNNLLKDCSSREQNNQEPVLLDMNDLLVLIKEREVNGNFSRMKKWLNRQCEYTSVYLNGDAKKCEEIFDNVNQAYEYFESEQYLENSSLVDVTPKDNKVRQIS